MCLALGELKILNASVFIKWNENAFHYQRCNKKREESTHTHTHTPGAVDTHTHLDTWSSGHTHTHSLSHTHTHTHSSIYRAVTSSFRNHVYTENAECSEYSPMTSSTHRHSFILYRTVCVSVCECVCVCVCTCVWVCECVSVCASLKAKHNLSLYLS